MKKKKHSTFEEDMESNGDPSEWEPINEPKFCMLDDSVDVQKIKDFVADNVIWHMQRMKIEFFEGFNSEHVEKAVAMLNSWNNFEQLRCNAEQDMRFYEGRKKGQ